MLTDQLIDETPDGIFQRVAEAAWTLQSNHERFLFKKARPHDHPSRTSWVGANTLWQDQVRARRARRGAAT